MAYVELQELRKTFGDVSALERLDISFERGEFVSFLGPSGCGKTTALRIVAGFEAPDEGRVVVDGQDLTRVPPNRRDMGMVFQAYSLFPNMTAAQNVDFGLSVRKKSRSERNRRVQELLEIVGLGNAGGRYPHQLSGGMQQRVALARALAIEPRILLLDEPLSALDAKVRVQLREEIRRVQTQLGITTLYVTHDQEEALSVSDRVAVLSHGKIEQLGPPAEIYDAPSTPFVAEFVGTMNRLESVVTDGTQGRVEYGGVSIAVEAARGRRNGERLLVLVRPETMKLEPSPNGSDETLAGEVLSHTFLGSVTRLRVESQGGEISADVPSTEAGKLPVGQRVAARFPAATARVLTLDERPASDEEDPDGR
ncbi:MAG TPA: ABC transporter ATP-binding protein [Gaiellaceae bacterium]